MHYFLVDNGSLRANSVLQMRRIGLSLAQSSGVSVVPCGLMHSHKIDPSELEGEPAQSMQRFLESGEAESLDEIRVLPFFLGPSLAITEWLPENLNAWKAGKPGRRRYRILDPLYREGDERLAQAVSQLCRETIGRTNLNRPRVAMVDHGTPLIRVNQVRETVGKEARAIMGDEIGEFVTCSMERRPDPQFDFNDPLLETLLARWVSEGAEEVLVSQFFLLPGRHAGPGGDLEKICRPFEQSGVRIERTGNLGEHHLIGDILSERIREDQAERS